MTTFLKKNEKWLPLLFALLFVLLTTSNLGSMHNPDELVHRVAKTLEGRWAFDTQNFDYPSLPKYVMFGVGELMYGLGYGKAEFYIAARVLSVLLGAATIYLVYYLARRAGGDVWASTLATLFMLANHILSINARFAHNDLYMLFFATLSIDFVLRYAVPPPSQPSPAGGRSQFSPPRGEMPDRAEGGGRGWLYASFFTVGLTASSKYNGGIFVLVPLVVWAGYRYKYFWAEKLRTLETLFISAALTFGGFALGTPKALLWMVYYFKRALPAISRHATFGDTANLPRGFIGQWAVMWEMFGGVLFLLALASAIYYGYKALSGKSSFKYAGILILAILVYDLPIMMSYNYQARFFLPLLPFFAILFGMGVEALTTWVGQTKFARYQTWVGGVALLILLVSGLRVFSVRLLLAHDARIPAGEFIDSLPAESSIEYTFYTPNFERKRFEREHDYPVYFVKHKGDVVPNEIDPGYPTNRGEAGLLARETDYFVVDSFTTQRCENAGFYETNPLECDFFAELLAGKAAYEMIGEFTYTLPRFLPQIEIAFVNPEIRIFQKR